MNNILWADELLIILGDQRTINSWQGCILNAFVGGEKKKSSTVTEQRTDWSLLRCKGGNLIAAPQQLDATFTLKELRRVFFLVKQTKGRYNFMVSHYSIKNTHTHTHIKEGIFLTCNRGPLRSSSAICGGMDRPLPDHSLVTVRHVDLSQNTRTEVKQV